MDRYGSFMRLTKIYTKIGDKGTTLLASGEKVSKTDPRIEAYGTVDELNSFIGVLRDGLDAQRATFGELVEQLLQIQNELFDIGGELSTPFSVLNVEKQQVVQHEQITRLEKQMDRFNETLAPLHNFVLPGGHPLNSAAHVARTVCRRAERRVIAFAEVSECRMEPRIYLNRLSDWLFVVGRIISSKLKVEELQWQQRGK
jgi:cob(I)alamin adenosyltransferase